MNDTWLQRQSARIGARLGSTDPQEQRNTTWRIATGLSGSAAGAFLGGPVLQAFFLHLGLEPSQIGLHGSVGSAAGALGMLLLMGMADRVRRRVRTVVLCSLILCLDPAVLLGMALIDDPRLDSTVMLLVLIVLAACLQPVGAFLNMVHAGLTVRIVHPRLLGRITGVSGVTAGLLAMLLGLVVARILAAWPAPAGFALCFALAVPLMALTALTYAPLVELPVLARPPRPPSASTVPWASLWEIYRLPEFRDVLVPNALRGMVSAFFFFAWVVGLRRLDMPVAYLGLATTVQAVAGSVIGSAIVGLSSDRWGPGPVIFAGSALSAACLTAMVLTSSPEMFLGLYGFLILGPHLIGVGVPLGTYRIVPPDLMGAYSGARLMLTSGVGALTMPIVGALLETVGAVPVFLVGSALSLVMGFGYWRGFGRHITMEPPSGSGDSNSFSSTSAACNRSEICT